MPIPLIKLSAVQVLGIACFGVALGNWLKHRLPIFDKLNIPSSIVGGLVFAVTTLLLRDRVVNFEMDLVLQGILMNAFFTTIGMGASLRLVKEGGMQVLVFFGIATLGAVLQNAVGIGLAKVLHVSPLLGIISGSVALTGGPATALAFGKTFEDMGVAGASAVGVASAMFGITAGGLMGGFIGGLLIDRNKLKAKIPPPPAPDPEVVAYHNEPTVDTGVSKMHDESEAEENHLLGSVIAIAVAMALGTLISAWFTSMSLVLPSYVGAMIAAAIIRNIDDQTSFLKLSQRHIDTIGNIALYIFIVMALLTLQLWQIATLALPFLIMLIGQIVLVFLMCVFLAYKSMGSDYEAAVMAGGFCGFMLGTTANAMACMDVITRKHGPAPRAFIVVPLVGAFLIDFTNAIIITAMANYFR